LNFVRTVFTSLLASAVSLPFLLHFCFLTSSLSYY
jgi:hypothetical protein